MAETLLAGPNRQADDADETIVENGREQGEEVSVTCQTGERIPSFSAMEPCTARRKRYMDDNWWQKCQFWIPSSILAFLSLTSFFLL